jgi:hypothetical protein
MRVRERSDTDNVKLLRVPRFHQHHGGSMKSDFSSLTVIRLAELSVI